MRLTRIWISANDAAISHSICALLVRRCWFRQRSHAWKDGLGRPDKHRKRGRMKMTKFELQMKGTALKDAQKKFEDGGHTFAAAECRMSASAYIRRIKRMKDAPNA